MAIKMRIDRNKKAPKRNAAPQKSSPSENGRAPDATGLTDATEKNAQTALGKEFPSPEQDEADAIERYSGLTRLILKLSPRRPNESRSQARARKKAEAERNGNARRARRKADRLRRKESGLKAWRDPVSLRNAAFSLAMAGTVIFALSLRNGWNAAAFAGVLVLFAAAAADIFGVFFALAKRDMAVVSHHFMIMLWAILLPLILMVARQQREGAEPVPSAPAVSSPAVSAKAPRAPTWGATSAFAPDFGVSFLPGPSRPTRSAPSIQA